jgi:imidazolonepropionase-like amidohydrolase
MNLTRRSFLVTSSAWLASAGCRRKASATPTAGHESTPAARRRTAAPGTTADEADLIFFGGPVLTSNDKAPRAEAVAVTRGIISAVGRASDVMAQKGSRTQLVELKGHALTPGFVDAHMHTAITIQDPWLDIGPMTTKDVDEAIAQRRRRRLHQPA